MNAIYAQARFRQRTVSSEKLDCGWRVCIANSVAAVELLYGINARNGTLSEPRLRTMVFISKL